MIQTKGLNRHLVISLATVTGIALAAMAAGTIAFYAFIFPHLFEPGEFEAMAEAEQLWPSRIEWLAFLVLWLAGLIGAMVAATRFARRLIRPLDAVAAAARRIATGDLSARAVIATGLDFKETQQLVEDFNAMAAQIGRADADMRMWHAAIAHELRTPLTILRGQLQGFVDGVFVPDTKAFQGLVAQAESLGRIVDDLKILTLAQSGRLELRLDTVDLAQEVAAVIAVVSPGLETAGLSVRLDLEPVAVRADGARIRQALMGLLENAKRYAAPGDLVIETRATIDQAILRVGDTGPGLTADAIEHVFEPFWRADDSRSRASGGSGLGLAVVQAIARAHGGRAVVRAAEPKGAIFEFQLPRRHPGTDVMPPHSPSYGQARTLLR